MGNPLKLEFRSVLCEFCGIILKEDPVFQKSTLIFLFLISSESSYLFLEL